MGDDTGDGNAKAKAAPETAMDDLLLGRTRVGYCHQCYLLSIPPPL